VRGAVGELSRSHDRVAAVTKAETTQLFYSIMRPHGCGGAGGCETCGDHRRERASADAVDAVTKRLHTIRYPRFVFGCSAVFFGMCCLCFTCVLPVSCLRVACI